MVQSVHAGNFQLDDYLNFAVLARDEGGGTTWVGDKPSHYDVIEMGSAGAPVEMTTDETFTLRTGQVTTDLYTPTTPIQLTEANGYEEGKSYAVIIKSDSGTTPTLTAITTFRIDRQKSIEDDTALIIDTETSDADLESTTTIDDTLMGRLRSLELNQQNIIHARLKRILGHLGEHQVVDGYLYDDDGNISESRVRLFDSKTNADAAALWRDRVNDSDPAPNLETGELYRYTLSATAVLPRNLRTTYKESINTDAADNDYIDGTDGSWGD